MEEVPPALLAAFPPSADLLLDLARQDVDDAMLMDIARADYGYGAVEVMPELRHIRDEGIAPIPIDGMLEEILSLTCFSDPDAPARPPFEPGPSGRRGHQIRLFACAVLLRIDAESSSGDASHLGDSALARGLFSANVLGEEMNEALARYLTWRSTRQRDDSELLFRSELDPPIIALGLLILAIRLRAGRLAEPDIGAIAEWVLALESLERRAFPACPMDLQPPPFSFHAGFWKPFVAEFKDGAESIRDSNIRTDIQLCSLLLDPYSA